MNNELRIRHFTDLNAWKTGHQLALHVYKITAQFPNHELFGLVSQMRRCAVSITSNIAEGFSRKSFKEKIQFYYIAQGSVTELQNQLIISKDVGFIPSDLFKNLYALSVDVHKIMNGLIKKSKEWSNFL